MSETLCDSAVVQQKHWQNIHRDVYDTCQNLQYEAESIIQNVGPDCDRRTQLYAEQIQLRATRESEHQEARSVSEGATVDGSETLCIHQLSPSVKL